MYKMVTSLFLDMCIEKRCLGYLNGARKKKGAGEKKRFWQVP